MSDTYVPWEDPTVDPWFQNLPTQHDIHANEYGQGFDGTQDDVDDRLDRMNDYLKMHQVYIPDLIPGIPDEVERPDLSEPLYRSDFVDMHRNDQAYNRVNELVQSGTGVEEAIAGVLQEAELNGWAMPLEYDSGDRLMNYDQFGNPVVQYTEDQYRAMQAAGELDESGVPRRRGDNSGGTDLAPLPPSVQNIDEGLFADNSRQFIEEISKEQRAQSDRDAAVAAYEDYHAPRFAFDFEGGMRDGVRGLRTDYAARAEKSEPRGKYTRVHGVEQPALGRGADSPSAPFNTPASQHVSNSYYRQQQAANRTNAANAASNEKINDAYRKRLMQYAEQGALPSRAQQRQSMVDNYIMSVAYGGSQ